MRLTAYKETIDLAKALPEDIQGPLSRYPVNRSVLNAIMKDARADDGLFDAEFVDLFNYKNKDIQ